MNIIEAFHDPNLLGAGIRDYRTYVAWETALRAIFGLGLTNKKQREIFEACTHRTHIPKKMFRQAVLLCGRRSGKSFMMALCAVFLALFKFSGPKPYLQRGEVLTIKVIAQDRDAARTIMRYIAGLLSTPLLKQKVRKQTANAFQLTDNVVIEVATCDYRAVRSYTCGAALCDEACFWTDDNGVSPAEAIFAALRPCMMTVPDSIMLIGSSPWGRRGAVFDLYDRWFGVENDHTLVWQADTLTMNNSIDPAEIQIEYDLDPLNAAAEYGANFRSDVQALLSKEVIDNATVEGRFELPYDPTKTFYAAIDASGGSTDSFTLGIAHVSEDGTKGVLDLVREVRPKFSPAAVCKEFSDIMISYNIGTCKADHYALEWVAEGFRTHGISLEFSELDLSAIYGTFLPLINSGKIELLTHTRLRQQLLGLERKTSRTKEIIGHPRGNGSNCHDDIAASACMALVSAIGNPSGLETWKRLGMMSRGELMMRMGFDSRTGQRLDYRF